MQGLLRQFIACDYCILNFVLFSSNFQILCPFFNISLPFFWNIAPMPLLSRIGPAYDLSTSKKILTGLTQFRILMPKLFVANKCKEKQQIIKFNRKWKKWWLCCFLRCFLTNTRKERVPERKPTFSYM